MFCTNVRVPRRAILKGLGAALALPFLDCMPAGEPSAARSAAGAPKRLVVVFFGNGVSAPEWWAKGAGASMELGPALMPLKDLRSQIQIVNGLWNEQATKGTIHSAQTGNLLAGSPLAGGGRIKVGESFDQVLASTIGGDTAMPSLVLGCERAATGLHKGYATMYSGHICWQTATNPVPVEYYPAQAFDRLFNNSVGERGRFILDRVGEDARRLQSSVGVADRQKLDEYFTAVHELDARLMHLRKARPKGGWQPSLSEPQLPRPADGMPSNIKEYHDLMAEILVLALQTDKTRIATLMLNNDLSGMFFPHLGLTSANHHTMSHDSSHAPYQKVTRYMVEQYAAILRRMAQVQEGGGSMLDHSAVLLCSSIWNGSNHDAKQVPMIIGGGLGGSLRPGRVLDYRDNGDEKRKLCSLYLGLMDRFGVERPSFGDASERLNGF